MSRKIQMWLDVAKTLSKFSTCSKLDVGCVITTEDFRVLATGYNGVPSKVTHCKDKACSGAGTKPGSDLCNAIHAEQNAIVSLPPGSNAKHLFCTHKPCTHCMKLIIAAGITSIYYSIDHASAPNELYNLVEMNHYGTNI